MIRELYEQLKSEVLKRFLELETDNIKIVQKYDIQYYVSIEFELEGIEFHWLLDNHHLICIDSKLKYTDEEVELIAKKVTKVIDKDPREFARFKLIKSLSDFNN